MSVKSVIKERPLHGQHARLVGLFDELIAEARKDDRSKLREAWTVFEKSLRAHITAEEEELLPGYAKVNPTEANAVAQDHAFFRSSLTEFGVDLDLHLVNASAVASFGHRLRTHAANEDKGLYPWAKHSLSAAALERFRRVAEGEAVGTPA